MKPNKKRLNDAELKITAIDVLAKGLGPVAAHRFLTLIRHDPTDYVEISRKLYKNRSVNDIYEQAAANWQR